MAPTPRRPVYVIGTSGLAREMAQLLGQLGRADDFVGFIAEDEGDVGRDLGFGRVVGDDAWLLGAGQAADIVVAIGHPGPRAAVAARYVAADDRFGFPNLVHPSAVLDPTQVRMGRGNVVTAGCVFTVDIAVGDFNLFNWTVTVGHDARIGSGCVINPGAHVSGGVSIGDRVLVGTGAEILEGLAVRDGAAVGAGVTVVGAPARPTGPSGP